MNFIATLFYIFNPKGIGKQSRSLFLELDASDAAKKSSSLQESPSMTKVGNHLPHTPRQNSQVIKKLFLNSSF